MKKIFYILFILIVLNGSIVLANDNITAFNHWDIVAVVNIDNEGNVATFALYCSERIKKDFVEDDFHREVEKWAGKMEKSSLLYAMKIQNSKKKSATWKISNETFEELLEISKIMRDARLDMK